MATLMEFAAASLERDGASRALDGTTPPAVVTPPMVHWGSAGRRALDERGKRYVKVSPSPATRLDRPSPRDDRARSRTGVAAVLHARGLRRDSPLTWRVAAPGNCLQRDAGSTKLCTCTCAN